jgi:hypoxanthine phosphoribosyltransferase
MEHLQVDPEVFKELSYRLLEHIRPKADQYQAILCPLRGGFFLSYFINQHLGLPIFYIEISSYSRKVQKDFQVGIKPELTEGKFLLCDDIYDSGSTIRKIHSMYPHVDFDTMCLVSKVDVPDIYYGRLIDPEVWVDFYWEVM